MKKFAAITLASAIALSACQTTDPYTGQQKTSNATKGAVLGALGGAIVGALTNTSSGEQAAKNALLGAGIGALAGGAVGGYMDQQEAKLRERLAGTGVSVTRVGNEIILNMPGNVTFATDSADVNSTFYDTLNSVAIVLNEFNKTTVSVTGHTDSDGSDDYNMALSQRRANAVGSYLIGQKVMPQRFVITGAGESQPIASNANASGKQQNRRVEIKIVPLTN